MKKIIILFLSLVLNVLMVFADVIPSYTTSIGHYGVGVLNVPYAFKVFEQPNESSRVLKSVNYEKPDNDMIISTRLSYENTLITYIPMKTIALVAVETNNEDGWFEIYYDQQNGKTGWVKQPNLEGFKTWKEVFYCWGKKNGLYIFKDVPEFGRNLYSQDSDTAQKLESLLHPKYINFSIIRGNWMLVNVLDYGQKSKIGWIRWRSDDGKLLLYPDFKSN